ncbi:MAG: 50S ribosomal protein L29 [Planctomycetota bacterium]
MNGAEIRALKDEELTIELGKQREKLYTLRVQSVTEKVEDTSQFRKIRKDIARLLTERSARFAKRDEKVNA